MSSESSHEDIPDVVPVRESFRPRNACVYCGSSEIVAGVRLGQTAEVKSFGLQYKGASVLGGAISIMGTEPLCVDLCTKCGTIQRFCVKQTNRNWATE